MAVKYDKILDEIREKDFSNPYQETVTKPGATGYSLVFDGSGDDAVAASGINYASTQSHSYLVWIYPTAVPSQYGWVINNGNSGSLGTSLIVRSEDGGLTFKIAFFYQGGNAVVSATTNLSLNTWQQIGASYDHTTNKVTFYLNGSTDGVSGTLGSWSGGTTAARLGSFAGDNHYFTGRIDEAGIYNVALSAAQFSANYNSGSGTYGTSSDTGIVYGWHLDENSGTSAASYATANSLALRGNTTWAAGKVNAPSSEVTATFIEVSDGVDGLEEGRLTIGHEGGGTFIEGKTIDIQGVTSVVINEDGTDTDTRIEGDTDANLIFADASANNVGVGTGTPTGGKLHVVPDSTTKTAIFVNAPSGYASAAHLLDLQINGTRKIGVDWQGYLTSPTHVIRFKRNDSTTAYLELKSEGPNGFGAISLSGTDALSRSSTGIDYGDIAGALNANFRGATVNFFNDGQLINLGSTNNQLRWNNFGTAFDNKFWIGQDDFVGNTNYQLRVIAAASTDTVIAAKGAASQADNYYEALPNGSDVPGWAIDKDFKIQFGDGAGTAVDTNLYRSAASVLKTDDVFETAARVRLNSVAGSTTDGDVWNDSTQKAIQTYVDSVEQTLVGTIFTQTATATVANTVTETTIVSTGVGTVTLPANFFVAGKTLKITACGHHSATGNPTINVRVKLGATTVGATGALTSHNSTNEEWCLDSVITCRTTGATGTVFCNGNYEEYHSSGAEGGFNNTTTSTIDTTASQTLNLTVEWGTADTGNTISCTSLIVEVLN